MKKFDEIVFRIWIVNLIIFICSVLLVYTLFYQSTLKGWYLVVPVIVMIIVYYGSFYIVLHQWLTKPITELTNIAYRFSQNDFENNYDFDSVDEFSQLGLAMNKLGKSLLITRIANHDKQEVLGHILESLQTAVILFSTEYSIPISNTAGDVLLERWQISSSGESIHGLPMDLDEKLKKVFETQETLQYSISVNEHPYVISMLPMYHENQVTVRGVLMIAHDVTEQENLDKMRSIFISNVSHDLRTPLTMIKGYSEAIMDDLAETREEKNEMAAIINDEVSEMMRIVNSLIELSKVQGGMLELNRSEITPEDFVEHVVKRFRRLIEDEGIQLTIDIDPKVKMLNIDEDKMHQVVFNLLDNAIRYVLVNGKETKEITISVYDDILINKTVIKITDNAKGIVKEDLPFVFERF